MLVHLPSTFQHPEHRSPNFLLPAKSVRTLGSDSQSFWIQKLIEKRESTRSMTPISSPFIFCIRLSECTHYRDADAVFDGEQERMDRVVYGGLRIINWITLRCL